MQGNPTRFRGVRVGFDVAIKTGAFDSEANAVQWRCQAKVVDHIAKCYACFTLSSVPLKLTQVNMTSDLDLGVALKILKAAGHQIGDAHIPPAPHGDAMRIWIDGVPCTLRGVLRMAEEEIEAKDEEKPEQPG